MSRCSSITHALTALGVWLGAAIGVMHCVPSGDCLRNTDCSSGYSCIQSTCTLSAQDASSVGETSPISNDDTSDTSSVDDSATSVVTDAGDAADSNATDARADARADGGDSDSSLDVGDSAKDGSKVGSGGS